MDPSFGARLRSERERQQIALRTIADRTKIKLSLLEALERDDVSQWPRGIFRRSHVRAYALAIGLDPDAVVREFLEIHPDHLDVVGDGRLFVRNVCMAFDRYLRAKNLEKPTFSRTI